MPQDLWYVRKDGAILGPYPAQTISRYLLLGRLIPACEVSLDQASWQVISTVAELLPLDPSTREGWDRERWLASMRWADERAGMDRRQLQDNPENSDKRRGADRRLNPEAPEIVELRRLHEEYEQSLLRSRRRFNRGAQVVALAAAATLAAVLLFDPWTPVAVDVHASTPDCNAPAAPGVNWTACTRADASLEAAALRSALLHDIDLRRARLARADLAYADLERARLAHADLRGARLLGANLSNTSLAGANLAAADLSHANLRGANLTSADLAGARLDHAIWLDGRVCAAGSLGACR
jgi:hypothetical protein